MSTVVFKKRDFSDLLAPVGVEFEVERYSISGKGGPKKATIRATGTQAGLFDLLELLRCPVEIYDEVNDLVWWGCVYQAEVSLGAVRMRASLDSMSNSIAVAYEDTASGERKTTSYLADTISTGEYGIKQTLASLSDASQVRAEAKRAELLERKKYPIPLIDVTGRDDPGTARLECRGWYATLDWQRYSSSSGLEAYEDMGSGSQVFGDHTDRTMVEQGVTPAASWSAKVVSVPIKKIGAPADNVQMSLYDAGWNQLALVNVAGTSLTTSSEWIEFELAAPVALTSGAVYHILVSRSGAMDPDNHYEVDVSEDVGYTGGAFRIWNGSTYVSRVPNADMNFRITGELETTEQIRAIATAAGEFITAVDIEDASGISTNQYRDGDATALTEIEELLDTGTANNRRLLCEVDRNRRLRVYEEPAAPTSEIGLISMDVQGRFYDGTDRLIHPTSCPAAFWCTLKDVVPGSLDGSRLTMIHLFFVEEMEYNALTGGLAPKVRDDYRLEDLLKLPMKGLT